MFSRATLLVLASTIKPKLSARKWEFAVIFEDITERKKYEQEIKLSEEKIRAVFDSVKNGILVIDTSNKKIFMANKAICDMTGTTVMSLPS